MNCLIGEPPERCCLYGKTPAWCVARLQRECSHSRPRVIEDEYEVRSHCTDCGKPLGKIYKNRRKRSG